MDLIKLLDVASPQTMKKTINQVITEFEDLTTSLNNSVGAAIGTASTAQSKAEQALASSETALTGSSNALVTAENALAMIEQADARSEEAASLAEQAFAEAQSATETAETAQAVALRAESTIDQVIGTGAFGTFVYDTNDIALSKVFLTDDITLEDTDERTYAPTPKAVKTALDTATADVVRNTDYATTTTAGVVKVGTGLGLASEGTLQVQYATENQIKNKNAYRNPITPVYLDLAVKTGLTTNALTFSDEEKAAARALLGAASSVIADAKLDKNTEISTRAQVYAKEKDGTQLLLNVAEVGGSSVGGGIPRYSAGGCITVSTPTYNAAAANKKYVDDAKAEINEELETLRNRASLPIGTVFASAIPLTDAGVHLLDGSYIAQDGIYAEFAALLKTLAQTYALTCTEEEFEAALSKTGNCGKFVINDTGGTIRLPKITKFIQGLTDITNIGTSIEAGLPNITGEFDIGVKGQSFLGINHAVGTFYPGNANVQNVSGGNIFVDVESTVYMDASRSSAVYGKSGTVQPPSTMYPYYIVLANSYQTDVQIDINQYTNELNAVLTTAASRFEERTKADVVSGLSWNNFNVSVFDSVFGTGWAEKLGRYACRANVSDDTSGVVTGLGYSQTYYVELNVWYVGNTNNSGVTITIKGSDRVSAETSIILDRADTLNLTHNFLSLRSYSMVPRGIMESFSLYTEDFWDGKILYTATRNCICSFRWGSSAVGYLNMDVFNAQGGVCYSLSTQANVTNDTRTFVFPMSPGMYIKLENVSSVSVNWCNLQICATD